LNNYLWGSSSYDIDYLTAFTENLCGGYREVVGCLNK